jgi:hypothetical protein
MNFISNFYIPPLHVIGVAAGSAQALPAGQAVQLNDAPPVEYMPTGHGVGIVLKCKLCNLWLEYSKY